MSAAPTPIDDAQRLLEQLAAMRAELDAFRKQTEAGMNAIKEALASNQRVTQATKSEAA